MAEYVNKEMFLSRMGLVGDETKYGNRDAEHQTRSYSTWIGYEIMDSIDDCVEEDVVEVVRCKDCKSWIHMEDGMGDCTNSRFHLPGHADPTMHQTDFCSCGERRTDNQ